MVEVKILRRTEFVDMRKGPPGVPSVMVTFQLADFRVSSVRIKKGEEKTLAEKTAIAEEIKRMGKPAGETLTV